MLPAAMAVTQLDPKVPIVKLVSREHFLQVAMQVASLICNNEAPEPCPDCFTDALRVLGAFAGHEGVGLCQLPNGETAVEALRSGAPDDIKKFLEEMGQEILKGAERDIRQAIKRKRARPR